MKHKKRIISLLLTLSLILSAAPMLSTHANAAAAKSLTLSVVGKNGLSSWEEVWYSVDGTLKNGYLDCYFSENPDGSGSVFPLVKSFDDSADGAILYSGLRETTAGTEPTLGCVRRGILFEELIDYASERSGAGTLRDGSIRAVTSDGKVFPYSDEPVRYADYYWGNTNRVFYRGLYESGGDISVCTEENSAPAPAVLAMVGYYKNVYDPKLAIKKLVLSADTKYSLRLFFGMNPDDLYDGAGAGGSAQNVQELIFYPEYREISVYGAQKNGIEGENGFYCETAEAKVYSSDNYFRASSGENVVLSIEPKTPAAIDIRLFGSESGASIGFERRGSLLSFDMTDEPVILQISADDDGDYSWYLNDPNGESFEIGSEGELRALAAIVGGDADNVGQFGFSGREIRLTNDIELVGSWPGIGNAEHPFEGTLDGCGNSITGLISRDAESAGLFLTLSGCVRRLHVSADITGAALAGAIAANSSGQIELCSVSGSVCGGTAGGLTGENSGSISRSISRADIIGTASAGGISGRTMQDSLIEKCLVTGSVSGDGSCGGVSGSGSGSTLDCAVIDTAVSDDTGMRPAGECVSAAEMCSDEFILNLGSGFAINGGCLPRLDWEKESGHSSRVVREWSDVNTGDVLRELMCISCGQHFYETVSSGSCDTGDMRLDSAKWDGYSIDVSFYFENRDSAVFIIDTAAKLAGAAAMVNGLVNPDCKVYTGSAALSSEQWNSSEYVFNGSGTRGGNNRSNDDYSYGCCDFSGKTLIVASDLDMSAGNYMPLGGQFLMEKDNDETKISASFCGVFDGRGHNIKIYCDRFSSDSYGNGQAVGLIGRLGVHDNDPDALRPQNAGVRDVSVSGYVRANRSVGGVVGKIGKTDGGAYITGCVNYAEVVGNDSQGTGGIVGSAFNSGKIASCFNAGKVSNPDGACGGIAGQCEVSVEGCYNIGAVSGSKSAAIAVYAGGSYYANCFYLSDSAKTGLLGYEIDGVKRLDETLLRSEDTLEKLGKDFDSDKNGINNGFPVLKWQNGILPERDLYYSIKGKTDISADKAETLVSSGELTSAAKNAGSIGASGVMILPDADVKGCALSSFVFGRQDVREISESGLTLLFDGGNGLRTELGGDVLEKIVAPTETERLLSWSYVLLGEPGKGSDDDVEITLEALDDETAEKYLSMLEQTCAYDITDVFAARIVIECKWLTPADTVSADLLIKVSDEYRPGAYYRVLKAGAESDRLAGECIAVDGSRYLRLPDVCSGVYIAVCERASEYADVSESAWYFDSVIKVSDSGLMSGTGDGRFAPLAEMTRAMLAQMLYRIAGEPEVTFFDGFSDVRSGDWYSRCASWGYKSGVITGYPDGSFGGERPVSRQELCQILQRFAGLKKLDVSRTARLDGFSDADSAAQWAAPALGWAVAAGLIMGSDGGQLRPSDSLSRAEAAAVAVRFLKML